MKFFIVLIISIIVLACIKKQFNGESNNKTSFPVCSWCSVECPDADLILILDSDGTFSFKKSWWNPQSHKHTKMIEKTGNWCLESDGIVLVIDQEKYRYFLAKPTTLQIGEHTTMIQTIEPDVNNPNNIFDRIPLLREELTDEFLVEAVDRFGESNKLPHVPRI